MDKIDFRDKVSPSINVEKTKFIIDPRQKKSSYLGLETVSFRIPANMANTFLDTKTGLCLKGKINLLSITGNASSKLDLVLDKAGVASCISAINIKIGGVSMSYDGYNIAQCVFKDLESNSLYAGNQGLLLEGLKQNAQGITLEYEMNATPVQINAERAVFDFCLPLHTLLETDQPIPLFGSAPIDIDIVLEDASKIGAYQYVEGGVNVVIENNGVNYTDLQLLGNYIMFSDQVMREIDNLHNGVYVLHSTAMYHSSDTIPTGATTFTSPIGVSVSSMKRVLVSHRDTGKILASGRTLTDGVSTESLSLGHRVNGLNNWNFEIDGVSYPTNPVRNINNTTTQGGGMFYELMNADDKYGVLSSSGSLAVNSGATDEVRCSVAPFTLDMTATGRPYGGVGFNVGSYITAYNFEVLNSGKSRSMRDGLSTVGSSFNYEGKFVTALPRDMRVDYFVQCDIKLVLDTKGSNVLTYLS
jgi:hypothetical protein